MIDEFIKRELHLLGGAVTSGEVAGDSAVMRQRILKTIVLAREQDRKERQLRDALTLAISVLAGETMTKNSLIEALEKGRKALED